MLGLPGNIINGIGNDCRVVFSVADDVGRMDEEDRRSWVVGLQRDLERKNMFSPETIPSEKRMNAMRCIIRFEPDLNFGSRNRGSRFQLRGKGQGNRFGGIEGCTGIDFAY